MKRNSIIFIAIGIVILLGIFFVPKPEEPTNETRNKQDTPKTAVSIFKSYDLLIKNRKIVSGQNNITVKKGDEITIHVTADEKDELHIHGYDESVELEPDKKVTLRFTANLTGRFPFELEGSKTDLGVIEVQP